MQSSWNPKRWLWVAAYCWSKGGTRKGQEAIPEKGLEALFLANPQRNKELLFQLFSMGARYAAPSSRFIPAMALRTSFASWKLCLSAHPMATAKSIGCQLENIKNLLVLLIFCFWWFCFFVFPFDFCFFNITKFHREGKRCLW